MWHFHGLPQQGLRDRLSRGPSVARTDTSQTSRTRDRTSRSAHSRTTEQSRPATRVSFASELERPDTATSDQNSSHAGTTSQAAPSVPVTDIELERGSSTLVQLEPETRRAASPATIALVDKFNAAQAAILASADMFSSSCRTVMTPIPPVRPNTQGTRRSSRGHKGSSDQHTPRHYPGSQAVSPASSPKPAVAQSQRSRWSGKTEEQSRVLPTSQSCSNEGTNRDEESGVPLPIRRPNFRSHLKIRRNGIWQPGVNIDLMKRSRPGNTTDT